MRSLTVEERRKVQFAVDNNRLEGRETDSELRGLFERVVTGELTKAQMKTMWKEYLDKKYGV